MDDSADIKKELQSLIKAHPDESQKTITHLLGFKSQGSTSNLLKDKRGKELRHICRIAKALGKKLVLTDLNEPELESEKGKDGMEWTPEQIIELLRANSAPIISTIEGLRSEIAELRKDIENLKSQCRATQNGLGDLSGKIGAGAS